MTLTVKAGKFWLTPDVLTRYIVIVAFPPLITTVVAMVRTVPPYNLSLFGIFIYGSPSSETFTHSEKNLVSSDRGTTNVRVAYVPTPTATALELYEFV